MQIATEDAALLGWFRRHVLDSGAGPQMPPGEATSYAASAVADRRAFEARQAQEKADNIARARYGPRLGNGAYPVSAEGRGHLGTVRAWRGRWSYTLEGSRTSSGDFRTRQEAAGMLVWVGDRRAASAARLVLQVAARQAVPAGWERGDWQDLVAYDIIRAPLCRRAEDDKPYPHAWRHPVQVRGVTRIAHRSLVVSVAQLNDGYSDPLFIAGQDLWDIGFLWPVGRARPRAQPHREKLRIAMSDILDDVSFVADAFIGDPLRTRYLMDLLDELSRSRTEDLFAGLRTVLAETAWLAEAIDAPEQTCEARSRRSWTRAAHLKAGQALASFAADPDFDWAGPAC